MKTLFILTEQMDPDRLEQQHLLCLAMLNFDFEVQVVTQASVLIRIDACRQTQQAWRALNLYGVTEFLLVDEPAPTNSNWPVRTIKRAEFERLLSAAGWVS